MQINLSLTVNLESTEITPIVAALLGQFQQMASQATQTAPDAIQGPELPATTSTPVLPAIAPATQEAEATPRPTKTKSTKPAPSKRPALLPADQEPPKRVMSGDRLSFAEFDPLVRSEMKRLSMDGRMPGHKLWDQERDPRLPTLAAVLYRYSVSTLVDLAEKLDMQPSLSALVSNGTNSRQRWITPVPNWRNSRKSAERNGDRSGPG